MKAPNMPTITLTLRMTRDVRARLQEAATAAGMALGPYIIWRAHGSVMPQPKAKRRVVIQDQQAFARLLGLLGASRMPSNLNQLAKAANSGSLPIDADTLSKLNQALDDISFMRGLLITALGSEESR